MYLVWTSLVSPVCHVMTSLLFSEFSFSKRALFDSRSSIRDVVLFLCFLLCLHRSSGHNENVKF